MKIMSISEFIKVDIEKLVLHIKKNYLRYCEDKRTISFFKKKEHLNFDKEVSYKFMDSDASFNMSLYFERKAVGLEIDTEPTYIKTFINKDGFLENGEEYFPIEFGVTFYEGELETVKLLDESYKFHEHYYLAKLLTEDYEYDKKRGVLYE